MTKSVAVFLALLLTVTSFAGYTSAKEATSLTASPNAPGIFVSTTTLFSFREVYVHMASDVQFYDVWGQLLQGPITINAPPPYMISRNCYDNFSNHIEIAPEHDTIPKTRIFVRMLPGATGVSSERIIHQSPETDVVEVAVSGNAIEPAIPFRYYDEATGSGSRLKTNLHHIIKDHTVLSYTSLWGHFETTDATFSGHVWDMYSDIPCQDPPYIYQFVGHQDRGTGGNTENQVFNREHSMPLSWFGGQQTTMATDLFHIFPTDKWVNALRANFPYGQVNSPATTTRNGSKLGKNYSPAYNGSAFEPIDAFKGDFARTFFYMITRYEDQINQWNFSPEGNHMLAQNSYPGFHPWALQMLLNWHHHDPVSQKEILRNNAVYQIQGNRNPFIDHPEFAARIWGDTTTFVNTHLAGGAVQVYPNPASGTLFVKSSETITYLGLYTTCGKMVLRLFPGHANAAINVSTLPPGAYIVRIYTANQRRNTLQIIGP